MRNIRTLTLDEKLEIHYKNEFLIKGFINIYSLMRIIKENQLHTFHDFIEKGKKIDLKEIVKIPKHNELGCFLFDNHEGHIAKNNRGIYRYITVSNEDKTVYYLDILDLLEIYYGANIEYILNNILNGEKEWRLREKEQLEENLRIFKSMKNPLLIKLLDVYDTIHKKAIEYHLHSIFSFNKEPIYFISTRYIANQSNISQAKANRDLVTLNKLGLIKIIDNKDLSKYVKHTVKRNPKLKSYYKDTRSFIILPFPEPEELEKRIEKLSFEEKKISKEQLQEIKEKNIREYLLNRMTEYGYLSVDVLKREEYPYIKESLLVMDKMFDKRKPTKSMKMKFNIENNQYVYVSKRK